MRQFFKRYGAAIAAALMVGGVVLAQSAVVLRSGNSTTTARVDADGRLLVSTGNNTGSTKIDGADGGTALVDGNGNLMVSLGTQIAGENVAGSRGAVTNWLEVYKAGTYTSAPTKTSTTVTANATSCAAAGGASCTVIYASTDWGAWPNLTITMKNTGSNTINDVLVEWSPDGTSWEVWDNMTFSSLAASGVKSISIAGNSRRYLRIEARASATAAADIWITANQG